MGFVSGRIDNLLSCNTEGEAIGCSSKTRHGLHTKASVLERDGRYVPAYTVPTLTTLVSHLVGAACLT